MSTNTFTYAAGSELPGLTLPWQEQTAASTWTDLDLSSGYTFVLTLVDKDGTAQLTKSTGITGQDGSVVVSWAVDDLDIAAGSYILTLTATETATSKDRAYSPGLPVRVVIT